MSIAVIHLPQTQNLLRPRYWEGDREGEVTLLDCVALPRPFNQKTPSSKLAISFAKSRGQKYKQVQSSGLLPFALCPMSVCPSPICLMLPRHIRYALATHPSFPLPFEGRGQGGRGKEVSMPFRYFTAGESHGKGGVVIVEGIPAGVPISEDYIQKHMHRRQMGYGRGPRQQLEVDRAEILTGVRHGLTMGGPIAMWVENKDFANWTEAMSVAPVGDDAAKVRRVTRLRPGHADFPGVFKYHVDDVRPILERSSARETAARVAAGAVCRRFLEEFGIEIHSQVLTVYTIKAKVPDIIDWQAVEDSPVRCADPEAAKAMMAHIDWCRDNGNTAGGVFEVSAHGVPIGLGSFTQWDQKLDGLLAQGMMSIQAVKGVEIGSGFENTEKLGSQVHDVIEPWNGDARPFHHITNRAGGTEGGMSNGEPLVCRMALKPISTLSKPLPSVDLDTGEVTQAHYERSDICQVPPACVVGEAVMATVIIKCFLEKFGGDHLSETRRNYEGYLKSLRELAPKKAVAKSAAD